MTRDDVLRLRDQIFVSLLVREGKTLDAQCASERAANIASWLESEIDDIVNQALKEAARGVVVVGTIGAKHSHEWRTARAQWCCTVGDCPEDAVVECTDGDCVAGLCEKHRTPEDWREDPTVTAIK